MSAVIVSAAFTASRNGLDMRPPLKGSGAARTWGPLPLLDRVNKGTTMNTITKALAIAGVAAVALAGTAAYAATGTSGASATVLKQVTLIKTSDLNFGTIVNSTAASTVTISPLGTKTCGTGLVCTGTVTAAAFGISGTKNQVVTITVSGPVTLTSGTDSMTATLLSSASSRTLTGTDSFNVGGTLNVAANQPDGIYTGAFNVTVDY